jgi:hypothetical protein
VVRRLEERRPGVDESARLGHADPRDAAADHHDLTAGSADPDEPGPPSHATDVAADDNADDSAPDHDDHSTLVGRRWGGQLLGVKRMAAG